MAGRALALDEEAAADWEALAVLEAAAAVLDAALVAEAGALAPLVSLSLGRSVRAAVTRRGVRKSRDAWRR